MAAIFFCGYVKKSINLRNELQNPGVHIVVRIRYTWYYTSLLYHSQSRQYIAAKWRDYTTEAKLWANNEVQLQLKYHDRTIN